MELLEVVELREQVGVLALLEELGEENTLRLLHLRSAEHVELRELRNAPRQLGKLTWAGLEQPCGHRPVLGFASRILR